MAQDTSTLGIIISWEKDAPLCSPEWVLRIEEVYEIKNVPIGINLNWIN